ncbi:hypothetical protein WA158_000444 [Blastocystis sp. Blastoise]
MNIIIKSALAVDGRRLLSSTVSKSNVVFILGLPGSGKGTHSKKLSEKYNLLHISAGELLRKAIVENDPNSKLIDETIKKGQILPAYITLDLIKKEIQKNNSKLTLLDGYPRNMDNYKSWFDRMNDSTRLVGVFVFESNLKDLENRIIQRGKQSKRTDDNIDSLKHRFESYERDTKPVIDILKKQYPTYYIDTSVCFDQAIPRGGDDGVSGLITAITTAMASTYTVHSSYTNFDFTLISQSSSERLFYLEYTIERWSGPLSIAVYCPTEKKKEIEYILTKLSLPSRVKVIVHIAKTEDYPINLLRNIAIESIETSHFWVADMDMWPNWDLYDTLVGLPMELLQDDKLAIIVPAFSYKHYFTINGCLSVLTCALLVKNEFPTNKAELAQCLRRGNCSPFRHDTHTHDYYFKGWKDVPSNISVTPVECFPNIGQEPYVALKKTPTMPYFDPRFINYGYNKVQWIETLRYSGYKFAVLSQSYAIDIPHPDSKYALNWRIQWSAGNVAMKDLYNSYLTNLHSGDDHSVVSVCQKRKGDRLY